MGIVTSGGEVHNNLFCGGFANCLQQFGVYNVNKDDRFGMDLVQDGGPRSGVFLHKILPKHSLILRSIYTYVNEGNFGLYLTLYHK